MEENKPYDSRLDTLTHIDLVRDLLRECTFELQKRATRHDRSKLRSPEKEYFDRLTPRLKSLEYGSQEYLDSLAELKVALDHHYANNSHHPEHYENGINGFDLFDLMEMFCDWMAATERTKDGSMSKSIYVNKVRFQMSDQLVSIFENTVNRYFQQYK